MVYRINRDPIIDNDRVLRVDRMRVGSHSQLSNSHMQGTTSGYASGASNVIDKFPFSSDGNASDVGDLTLARSTLAGQSSSTNGYASGGFAPSIPGQTNVIDKFPFSSDANASDVGDLTNAFSRVVGQSSTTHGYVSGGYAPTALPGSNIIQKFTYASDANATDVGDLTIGKYFGSGHSSPSNGYFAGGAGSFPPTFITNIDKFPFASDANATNIGNIDRRSQDWNGGISSDLSGYMSFLAPSGKKDITKFSFIVDGDTQSEVGDLTQARDEGAGQNSTANGYVSGGLAPPPFSNTVNTIDKFPFSADADATDVGDLTRNVINMVGQQV
jgi:hypothetical protein